MKRILIITQCCACFLLAATATRAQSGAKPAVKVEENALKPVNKVHPIDDKAMPVPKPELIQNSSTPVNAEMPSPFTRDKDNKAPETSKPKMMLVDGKIADKPMSEENRSTMNGKAQPSKQQVYYDKNEKPAAIPKNETIIKPAAKTGPKDQKPGQ